MSGFLIPSIFDFPPLLGVERNGVLVSLGILRGEVGTERVPPSMKGLALQVEEYLSGERNEFDIPMDISGGTGFQQAVWTELLKIPYGEVRTYGEIARAIGRPGSARAVGGAVGKNPILLLVPCHRVVASDGMGGFSAGVGLKERLLRLEGSYFHDKD